MKFTLKKGIATCIALFVLCFFAPRVSAQDAIDDCHIAWLEKNWQDSTEYTSLEQTLVDQVLQIFAVRISEPNSLMYANCIDSVNVKTNSKIPSKDTTITIFSPELSVLAVKWNLAEELVEYRATAQEFLHLSEVVLALEKELAEKEQTVESLEVEEERLTIELQRAELVNTFLSEVVDLIESGMIRLKCRELLEPYDFDTISLEELEKVKKEFYECQK